MESSISYFQSAYAGFERPFTFLYPKESEKMAKSFVPLMQFGLDQFKKYLRIDSPKINFILVAEHDWSKTPSHDIYPYGLTYLTNQAQEFTVYLSESIPDYYMVTDFEINHALVCWHELGRFFFNKPNFQAPISAPHWLTEGLPQLGVWTLIQDRGLNCDPIEPVETKLRDQTHFTILEYEPSIPVKPARYAKYQWLLLFMMRDLSEQYTEHKGGNLLADIIPALRKAPKRLDYIKAMDFLSDLLGMNVGDWLSTRWYF